MMRVLFLGTGTSQGVPVIACTCAVCLSDDRKDKRLRSSVLVEQGGVCFVIDTGPDFRMQMLQARVQKMDAVLYTHPHKDHTGGLDDLRAFSFKQKRKMPLYGQASCLSQLQRDYAYIFSDTDISFGLPQVSLHPVEVDKVFTINGIRIQPIELLHARMLVLGFRIGDFAYITDANAITEKEKRKLHSLRYLVVNALRQTPHFSHFTLSEALSLAQEVGAQQTYFTHISHFMGKHAEVNDTLPANASLAYDGLELRF